MQIHEDKQVQHTASDRLQRSSCYRKTGHPMVRGGVSRMDGNRESGHAERVRQLRDANPDPSGDYFIIDRAAFNQGENAKFDMQITRGGVLPNTGR